jgi:hypothetical protein
MVSPTFNFSGAQQSITASLTASGSATISGSGTYYSWVGWPINTWASVTLSLNSQTVGIGTNPDTININKNPMGNGQVGFERLTLANGQLLDLNATDLFGGSAQDLALDRITVTGDVELLGLPVGVEIRLDTAGTLSNFNFDMTAPAWTLPQGGTFPTKDYMWIGAGNAGIDYNLALNGEMEVLGFLTIPLGQLFGTSGHVNFQDLLGGPVPLLGTMSLTELAGPYPKDVQVHINSNFDQFTPVTVPFTTAGNYSYDGYSGGDSYYKLNLNYDFAGSLSVDNVSIDLYSTIADIVPEPITLAVFGLGAGLLSMTCRRSRK